MQASRSATLLKGGSNTGVFCEYCKIFKKTYFEENLRTTASAILLLTVHIYSQGLASALNLIGSLQSKEFSLGCLVVGSCPMWKKEN